jgi:TIR domain
MGDDGHIFISYARRDGLAFAEKLEYELESQGLKVWRDKRNIDP